MNAFANIGIDITSLSLYIVNFGVVIFFIGKYVTGPLIDMLEKRRSAIEENLTEAETLKNEMAKQKEVIELERKSMKEQLHKDSETAKVKGQELAAQIIKSAEEKKIEILNTAQLQAQKQIDQVLIGSEKEIKSTVKRMISHIVSNKLPEDLIDESVKDAWEYALKEKND